jgi:hypothetical protein
MEGLLGKLSVRAKRFNAIQANRDSVFTEYPVLQGRELSEFIRMGFNSEPPKLGAISNYLSKRTVFESAASTEREFTLVLEDDIFISKRDMLPFAVWKADRMKVEWDVLLFDPAGAWRSEDKVGWNLYFPRATFPVYWGSHALLLNNQRAEHVIRVLDTTLVHNIDGILFPNRTEIRTFAARTGMCAQGGFGSDIRL